jgi:hypothetical protein
LTILGQELIDPVFGRWCDGLQQEDAAVILHAEIDSSLATGVTAGL